MQVTVEKLSPVLVELKVEVPAERVKSELDRAYGDLQRTARVRGFRPGKAPRDVLVHLFGARVAADVSQRLVDGTLSRALSEKQVQPVSQPSFDLDDVSPGVAFSYRARFEVRPEIEGLRYEGLTARRPPVEPTPAQLDAAMEEIRKVHSTLVPPEPERPARRGDVVTVDVDLEVEGRAQERLDRDLQIEIGGGEALPQLEEALIGAEPGQERRVELDIAPDHSSAALRGKHVVLRAKVKDVKERRLPEVDDELARDEGLDSLAALRDRLRERIEKELRTRANDRIAEQLVAELCKANPIPCPPSLVQQQAQLMEEELRDRARRGQAAEMPDALRAQLRAEAEMKVRAGLLMAEIARRESVRISDEDIEKGYAELAEQTGRNVAKVKADYRDAKRRELLLGMILEDKILDLLEAKATITDEPATTAEAPAQGE